MKIRFAMLFFILMQSILSAQVFKSVGIKGGATSTHWTNYDSRLFTPEHYWGENFGIYAELFPEAQINLVTEILFVSKGTDFHKNTYHDFGIISPRANYLSIPLLLKYSILKKSYSPYLIAGPRYDVLLKINNENPGYNSKNTSSVNFGFTLGAGMELMFTEINSIGFELRYAKDFTKNNGDAKFESIDLLVFLGWRIF